MYIQYLCNNYFIKNFDIFQHLVLHSLCFCCRPELEVLVLTWQQLILLLYTILTGIDMKLQVEGTAVLILFFCSVILCGQY
jgi:hypothetical protein